MHLSVVVPTIGREFYLDLSLRSLVDQTDFDEIVVFDNSPSQRLQETSSLRDEPRIRWEKSGGGLPPTESWNTAVRRCRSEWVTIFGDDDVAGPDFAEKLRAQTYQAGLVYAPFHLIDEKGNRDPQVVVIPSITDSQDFRHQRMDGAIYCVIPGFAFKKDDFISVGGFRKLGLPNDLYCDDDLWFRLSAKAGGVRVVESKTWSYRRHLLQVGRRFDLAHFVRSFDGFSAKMCTALTELGVPEREVYPRISGARGYKKRILDERVSLWLALYQQTIAAKFICIWRLEAPFSWRLLWWAKTLKRVWVGQ